MKSSKSFILACCCLLPMVVAGQTVDIFCPNSPYVDGLTYYFGVNVVSFYSVQSISVNNSNGSASILQSTVGTTQQGDGFYHSSFECAATFSSAGEARLTVSGVGNGANCTVTVREEWTKPPVVSIVTNENCGYTTVYRRGDPPPGITWWWMTDPTQKVTALGSGNSIVLNSSAQVYIRASNAAQTQWSDAASVGFVNVVNLPPPPPTIAQDSKEIFGGSATLSVGSVPGAIYYNWYNNSEELVHEGISFTSKFKKTETFYVSASNGCESYPLPVTVTVLPPLKIVVMGGGSADLRRGPLMLATQGDYDSYYWYYSADDDFSNLQMLQSRTSVCQASQAGYYKVFGIVNGLSGNSASSPFKVSVDQNTNFVATEDILIKGITDPALIDALPVTQKRETFQYFDGLGRLSQTVTTQGSPGKKDIVHPMGYDAWGQEPIKYLLYTHNEGNGWYKTDATGSILGYSVSPQRNFYQAADAVAKDNAPYAQAVFDRSPLSRVLKQGTAGTAWQPDDDPYSVTDKTIKKRYEANTSTDNVLLFSLDADLNLQAPVGHYSENQLWLHKTIDENGNEMLEYSDKEGKMICKKVQYNVDSNSNKLYAETYYIYDDLGNLVIVLPPEAVKSFLASQ